MEPVPSGTPSPEASQECRLPRGDSTILSDELLDVGLYAAMADFGPRAGAEGTVTYAEDGSLASYLVAPGIPRLQSAIGSALGTIRSRR